MRKSRSKVGVAGIAVAMLAIGVGLEVHFAVARPSLARPSLERSDFHPTPVDRTLKGNRLPGASGGHAAPQHRLPDGCEPRFSRTIKTDVNEVARHCVT
jgi:hypothetical protein